MEIAKTILGVLGGVLLGLYFTGHDFVGAVGLSFDKQLFVGLLAFILCMVFHVMGGGEVWPAKRER